MVGLIGEPGLTGIPQPSVEELVQKLFSDRELTLADPHGAGDYIFRVNINHDGYEPVIVLWRPEGSRETYSIEVYAGIYDEEVSWDWGENTPGFAEVMLNAIMCGRRLYLMRCGSTICSRTTNP